ncbi:LOW QUALITY PROTEIN: hypothetical protein CVT26_011904 [Gymnopilus dilepis]|uniref:Uncharacterized protein n=1 Tax=Gymnopilus dilepis TaxID=231916 RepID=A0A409WNF1_9AGAR|nr:LOW QUALITY PROTEIN: hypothetical protein CVT26_011904 [Gymnopilus dilepis]
MSTLVNAFSCRCDTKLLEGSQLRLLLGHAIYYPISKYASERRGLVSGNTTLCPYTARSATFPAGVYAERRKHSQHIPIVIFPTLVLSATSSAHRSYSRRRIPVKRALRLLLFLGMNKLSLSRIPESSTCITGAWLIPSDAGLIAPSICWACAVIPQQLLPTLN